MAFCHVPPHLIHSIRAYRLLAPLRGHVASAWSLSLAPMGLAVSSLDHTVLATDFQHDCVRAFSMDGTLQRIWGREGSAKGEFCGPWGIAVSQAGEVVVADCYNDRIQVFQSDGVFLRQWGEHGWFEGQLDDPAGVAITPDGTEVVVTELSNHRVQVFRLSDGAFRRTWGAQGSAQGNFDCPSAVCVTATGQVIVGDRDNCRVQVFQLDGTFLHQWEPRAAWRSVSQIAARGDTVLVTTEYIRRVHAFRLDGMLVCTWAFPGDNPEAPHGGPTGLAVTRGGQVLAYDKYTHQVLVLE